MTLTELQILIQQKVKQKFVKEFLLWKPYIYGLAFFEKSFLEKATLLEQFMIQEICLMQEKMKENQIVKSEWVERKK